MYSSFVKLGTIIASGFLLVFLFLYSLEYLPSLALVKEKGAYLIASIFIIISIAYKYLTNHGAKSFVNQLLIWLCIFFCIITGYAFRFEMLYTYHRVLAVLLPSYSWVNANGQFVIARSSDGHFYTDAIVNGKKLRFMIDTGASDVALTKKDAIALKIDFSKLKFTRIYNTANGSSAAAPITLQSFNIGPAAFRNIEGHIGQGELDTSLLGMSVISRFKSFKIDKDLLTLSY